MEIQKNLSVMTKESLPLDIRNVIPRFILSWIWLNKKFSRENGLVSYFLRFKKRQVETFVGFPNVPFFSQTYIK